MKKLKLIPVLLAAALIAGIAACSFSTTLAQSLAGIEAGLTAADPTLEAKLGPYFSAAITAATNWKSGTFSQELEEGLSVLGANLDLIPLGSKADSLIAAAINFVDNEITILQKAKTAKLESPAAMEAAYYAWLEESNTPAPTVSASRKHQWHGAQIKSFSQLKKEWNKLAPKNAKLK